ncbi:AAA family ATPase [candidate division BRC1 bacterium HGW-BRC1-1]|jgi:putative ATPase|nr:MAG: AAA family ATPase [candidate division BRC1 bacterium HGW-BRC1-1]
MDLFDTPAEERPRGEQTSIPLAERMRPETLDEFVGQEKLVAPGAALRQLIESDALVSIILWGPPGSGKTTLASIIARMTRCRFSSMSAVTTSIKDVKVLMEAARMALDRLSQRTILFIDEIHRFNKAQQDAFLPFVEEGAVVLVGATTENPSFSLISALLSRCRIFVLEALDEDALVRIMRSAIADDRRGLGAQRVDAPDDVLRRIAELSDGDARRALNLLGLAVQTTEPDADGALVLSQEVMGQVLQRQHLVYDKTGEEHFNLISAFHKSMRSSDAQAAAYWAMRMLASGEDPLYVARRMIRFASEDVGNADPQALSIALAARESFTILGSPEGELALLQCAVYLATAPKSNALYAAQGKLRDEIRKSGSLPVPMHIRNAPTRLMKDLGYGKGYQYDHDHEGGFAGQDCLPDGLSGKEFYKPIEVGFEREIARRMEWWEKQRKRRGDGEK